MDFTIGEIKKLGRSLVELAWNYSFADKTIQKIYIRTGF